MAFDRFQKRPGSFTFGETDPLWSIGSLMRTDKQARTAPGGSYAPAGGTGGFNVTVGGGQGVQLGTGDRYSRRGPQLPQNYGSQYEAGPGLPSGRMGYGGDQPSAMPGGGGAPMPDRGGGVLKDIGKFIGNNPEVVTGALGTAADMYGAAKDRKEREKEREMRQEELEKRREMDQIRMILSAMSSF